jgi:hypothetical protein
VDLDEKQLTLLRNLKFKYFLMAIFGKCIDSLLGRKKELKTLSFTPDASRKQFKTITELVVEILPAVELVMTCAVGAVNGKDLSDFLEESDALSKIVLQVSTMLYVTMNTGLYVYNPSLENFKKMIN